MPSVTSRASATIAPRPMPGKTSALLPWPTRRVRPPCTTAGEGLPLGTRARAPVQRKADAGRARAQDHDALAGQRHPEQPRAGGDPGQGHRRRALDVVVEGGQDLAVAVEERESGALAEVLPLQERAREAPPHRLHE